MSKVDEALSNPKIDELGGITEQELKVLEKEEEYIVNNGRNTDIKNLANVSIEENITDQELYDSKEKYNSYLRENEENFTTNELTKMESNEAYEAYMNLSDDEKQQLFPMSETFIPNNNEYIADDIDNLNDILITEDPALIDR